MKRYFEALSDIALRNGLLTTPERAAEYVRQDIRSCTDLMHSFGQPIPRTDEGIVFVLEVETGDYAACVDERTRNPAAGKPIKKERRKR